MHCNFICGLSDVTINTFSQSVCVMLRAHVYRPRRLVLLTDLLLEQIDPSSHNVSLQRLAVVVAVHDDVIVPGDSPRGFPGDVVDQ